MTTVQGLKGTRDFYPKEMNELNLIFNAWKSSARKFNYQEFDGPMLEPAELWTLKSGAEIPEQMYCFDDKSGKKIAVRPELTPTLARMIAAKQKELQKPIKWFSIARCWRYEAPQSGRLREFFQLNVDCLGAESMMADAEVIATAVEIMKSFSCTENDFYVRLNNRKLIASLILNAGIEKTKLQEVSRVIDKKDKLSEKDFILTLKDLNVKQEAIDNILVMLKSDIADIKEEKLDESGKKGYRELMELIGWLNAYGIFKYCKIDFTIMRGFDYYTSTVFEVFDKSGEFRAIAGGGRYDDLVSDFGGEKCPGVGYGMGDVVLSLFLKKSGKLPEAKPEVDYYVAPVNEAVVKRALEVANKLRKKANVEMDLAGKNLMKQFDYANSIGARKIVIVGEKDLKEGKVTIRDMKSGNEEKADLNSL
ncbi:MAG: histidine--tRNA ligase [Candidatus Nanoarchaeia archaeon]|nr:histidine--tRNA ligase [Candidatus Nanoarchaeia archaeon]